MKIVFLLNMNLIAILCNSEKVKYEDIDSKEVNPNLRRLPAPGVDKFMVHSGYSGWHDFTFAVAYDEEGRSYYAGLLF